jgi:3-oxoacyl-[acyl-carrier-protein] synthase III
VIPVALRGTGSALPGRAWTTAEVAARLDPPGDPAKLVARTGIHTRHWAAPGERSAPLGAVALRAALDAAGMAAADLRRIVFCSSGGGDFLTPPTASRIADLLGLTGSCDAFDLSNACTGFLTGVDLAARALATGSGPVAVVAVEVFSDFLRPDEPRTFVVFGDAAAAAVFDRGGPDEGVLGVCLRTDPTPGLTAWIDHPRHTGVHQPARFGVSNADMADGVVAYLKRAADEALADAGLALGDLDWVLPHQPNGPLFDRVVAGLGCDPARTVRVVDTIGSCGCASVPYSLDRLVRSGALRPGQTVLLLALGSGVGFGALVLRVGPRGATSGSR